jgi:hypothetical protein
MARLEGLEPPTHGLEVRSRHLGPSVPERDEVRRNQHLAGGRAVPHCDGECPNSMLNRHQNRHHRTTDHGTENPGVGSSILPCPPFLFAATRHNPALGAAFRHFGSCERLVMDCDPLGWFLTADWPPFDPPFPERRSRLWRGCRRPTTPAPVAAMACANTVDGGLVLHPRSPRRRRTCRQPPGRRSRS